MYKRIFYGITPETLKNVRESSKYVLVTMGILASLTLILGLYPDLFYKPIIGYVENLYNNSHELIPVKITPGTAQLDEKPINNTKVSNVASSGGTGFQRTYLISENYVDHPTIL
jgi:formate hydrogenlyase subunit 3/multisubunit Na+/H+ antiporter MnhD subunit